MDGKASDEEGANDKVRARSTTRKEELSGVASKIEVEPRHVLLDSS